MDTIKKVFFPAVVAILCISLWMIFNSYFSWTETMGVKVYGLAGPLLLLSSLSTLVLLKRWARASFLHFLSLTVLSFSLVTGMSESVLRLYAPEFQSYAEMKGQGLYVSPFYVRPLNHCAPCGSIPQYVPFCNDSMVNSCTEFSYVHHFNDFGLRDREFSSYDRGDDFVVVGLGDSFTEGVGAPGDSTWPHLLENELNTLFPNRRSIVMNGGVSGSDLFYSQRLLEGCFMGFRPDMVVLCLNMTDCRM